MKLTIYLVLFVLDVFFTVVEGFLLATFWGWFISPIFHLPLLSVPQAIGLMLTVVLITYQRIPIEETAGDFIDRVVSYKLILWSSVLLLASVVHFFFL